MFHACEVELREHLARVEGSRVEALRSVEADPELGNVSFDDQSTAEFVEALEGQVLCDQHIEVFETVEQLAVLQVVDAVTDSPRQLQLTGVDMSSSLERRKAWMLGATGPKLQLVVACRQKEGSRTRRFQLEEEGSLSLFVGGCDDQLSSAEGALAAGHVFFALSIPAQNEGCREVGRDTFLFKPCHPSALSVSTGFGGTQTPS